MYVLTFSSECSEGYGFIDLIAASNDLEELKRYPEKVKGYDKLEILTAGEGKLTASEDMEVVCEYSIKTGWTTK